MKGGNSLMPLPKQENKTYKALIVCAYCGKIIGEKDGFEQEGLISHGICEECLAKLRMELALAKRKKFLKNNFQENE
jgi:hypothetical protein